jgi:uncharacterized protein YjbJ (UPF0337 family)
MSKLSRSLGRKAIVGVTAAVAPVVLVGTAGPVNAMPAAARPVTQRIAAWEIPAPAIGLLQDGLTKLNDAVATVQAALTTAGDTMGQSLHEAEGRVKDAVAEARETLGKALSSPEEPGEE